jgi:hypothetical protein
MNLSKIEMTDRAKRVIALAIQRADRDGRDYLDYSDLLDSVLHDYKDWRLSTGGIHASVNCNATTEKKKGR